MSVPLYVGQFLEMSRQRTAAWHLGECETMPTQRCRVAGCAHWFKLIANM